HDLAAKCARSACLYAGPVRDDITLNGWPDAGVLDHAFLMGGQLMSPHGAILGLLRKLSTPLCTKWRVLAPRPGIPPSSKKYADTEGNYSKPCECPCSPVEFIAHCGLPNE